MRTERPSLVTSELRHRLADDLLAVGMGSTAWGRVLGRVLVLGWVSAEQRSAKQTFNQAAVTLRCSA